MLFLLRASLLLSVPLDFLGVCVLGMSGVTAALYGSKGTNRGSLGLLNADPEDGEGLFTSFGTKLYILPLGRNLAILVSEPWEAVSKAAVLSQEVGVSKGVLRSLFLDSSGISACSWPSPRVRRAVIGDQLLKILEGWHVVLTILGRIHIRTF